MSLTIEIEARFDEPHILAWDNAEKFGVPSIVHPALKEEIERIAGQEGRIQGVIKSPNETFTLDVIRQNSEASFDPGVMVISSIYEGSYGVAAYETTLNDGTSPHYSEFVYEDYSGRGVATFMRTVLDNINGILPGEYTEYTDRFLFLLRRGYAPTRDLTENDMMLIEKGIKAKRLGRGRFEEIMYFTHDTEKARTLWNQLNKSDQA